MDDTKYFASLPADKIGAEIFKKVEDYYQFLLTSGRLLLWRRSYEAYYRPSINGSRLNRSGQQGEFTSINVNHYRNLLLHLKTMTTQQRPAFEPRATNSDYKSQAQTILASGLLDYYMREKKMERYIKSAVEQCLVFGEGFIRVEWDTALGEVYGVNPETQAQIREGDLKYTNFTPVEVIRDFSKNSSDDHDYYILRSFQNKYNLMAKYPDLAEKINEIPSKVDIESDYRFSQLLIQDSEDIPVYEFYHRRSAAMPDGRVTTLLSDDCVLLDGPLPYRNLPVYRISPEEQVGTTFGYTVGYDLMPIQEALDGLYSTAISNQSTFGIQNVMMPKGSDLSVNQLAGGFNLVEYDSKLGKPEALNLTSTPPEIFNFMQMLEKLMETISGVNSVARGNPENALAGNSGAALALVQSMAIQFSMGLQQSYAQLLEDLGTATINILRDFASVPRVAVIAGKSNRSLMQQFTGDDLDLINRVVVDMGNPLTRTTAGKVNLAESMMQNQLIQNPDQYIQVVTTGRLEPVIEGVQAELLNIKAENEELANSKPVPVVITDNHAKHILEHKVVLASPEARRNPQLIETVTTHIQEHLNFLKTADPALLQLLGSQPIPGGNPHASQMMDPNAAQPKMPNQPSMPQPPQNTDPRSAQVIEEQAGMAPAA